MHESKNMCVVNKLVHYFERVLKARTMTSLNSMSRREMTPSCSQDVKHLNTLALHESLHWVFGPRHACNEIPWSDIHNSVIVRKWSISAGTGYPNTEPFKNRTNWYGF